MRIVINGFGRIGRTILRQLLADPAHDDIEVALVNDIAPLETCAYLFQYDSTFGPYPEPVMTIGTDLVIGARRIAVAGSRDISTLDLSTIDVVLDCTGDVPSRDIAKRGLRAGARAVLISGPSKHADTTVVIGANEKTLGGAQIVSNSSCTTNAIAPLLKALDMGLGIERAHVTTIHCVTGSQPMVDAPRDTLERSRAGAESMVPTSTSATSELQKVVPYIAARTSIAAVRVPCLGVSAIDATVQLRTSFGASAREFLQVIANRTCVIGATDDPCVSRDLRARPESLVLALPETMALDDTQLRIFGWYDNEWGFSARMIEMARTLAADPHTKEILHGNH
ncbi:MAG: glyceraldehyde 3-phosphate dehydrogenase [Akkermansiaceae bacterium]|jgi:glyceraldehyde 3-phosphate dehydrogenase